jgi:hypothetical protein
MLLNITSKDLGSEERQYNVESSEHIKEITSFGENHIYHKLFFTALVP